MRRIRRHSARREEAAGCHLIRCRAGLCWRTTRSTIMLEHINYTTQAQLAGMAAAEGTVGVLSWSSHGNPTMQ